MTAKTKPVRATKQIATRLTICGLVQGIGMRPAIARFAQRLSLSGYVGNAMQGVEVHVEGSVAEVERFKDELCSHLPAQAIVDSYQSLSARVAGYESFKVCSTGSNWNPSPIPPRAGTTNDGTQSQQPEPLSARVPADVVVCRDCLAEIRDKTNRRYRYPFTSCTNCGPRYSIIDRMPYERADTAMESFVMCDCCQEEYRSVSDRRFHAQTNACPDCGPQVWMRAGNEIVARHQDAIEAAAKSLLDGDIVAMRGLGGYQLLVDATSQNAVEKLRARKRRHCKPLAVMVASLDDARKLTWVDEAEETLLCSTAGPIVVSRARLENNLADSVAGGLGTIGIMMATTPLHWLFLDAVKKPVVCTSGNNEGAPIIYDADIALKELGSIVDIWLEHDRPIRRPIDDSVVCVMAGRPVVIRLGRGYAPLTLNLKAEKTMVAVVRPPKDSCSRWQPCPNGPWPTHGRHGHNCSSATIR